MSVRDKVQQKHTVNISERKSYRSQDGKDELELFKQTGRELIEEQWQKFYAASLNGVCKVQRKREHDKIEELRDGKHGQSSEQSVGRGGRPGY